MDKLQKDLINASRQFTNDIFDGIVQVMEPLILKYKGNIEEITASTNSKILKKKREREQTPILEKEKEEVDEEDASSKSSSDSPVLTKKVKKDNDNPVPDFECPGTFWTDPVVPCKKGTRAHIRDGIQITGENGKKKNITLCRDCKNIRTREKRKEKKQNV